MVLGLSLFLFLSITSFAAYEDPTSFNAKLNDNTRAYADLERAKNDVETTANEIAKLEQRLSDMEDEYLEACRICDELESSNKTASLDYIHNNDIKIKYEQLKTSLETFRSELVKKESKVSTIEAEIAQATDEAMAWGGYSTEETKNDTYQFKLVYENSQWMLTSVYRSWTPAHGGMWEYDTFVIPSLTIAFYDNDVCLSNGLARAESYDTDEELYWSVPFSIVDGQRYYIEINGKRYGVVAHNYESGNAVTDNTSDVEGIGVAAGAVGMSISGELAKTYTWKNNEKGWWVEAVTGSYPVNQWYQSPASGLWYFMGADGYMLTNAVTPDGYYVNTDGVWVN